MKKVKWISIILLLLVAGCTSTSKITTSWKAENTVPQKYSKILVLGLIRDADRSEQINMEIHFAGDLQELGYHAVPSMQEYGPKAFDKMDEESTLRKLKNSGVDAVITIVLLNREKERKYIPGNIHYFPHGHSYNRFWGYRTALYNRIYEPGYYVKDTKCFWETNFYNMRTQKLMYSVQTQSFEPANSDNMGHAYGQMIVKDMVKNNVLKKIDNLITKAF